MKNNENRAGYPKIINKHQVKVVEGTFTTEEGYTIRGGGQYGFWGCSGMDNIDHRLRKFTRHSMRCSGRQAVEQTILAGPFFL